MFLGSSRTRSLSLTLLLLLSIPAVVSAQPARPWSVRHDEGGMEQGGCPTCETSYLPIRSQVRGRQAFAADSAGNTYVTGSTTVDGTEDVLTVKYNTQGVQQWAVLYNGEDVDRGFGVAVDASGNVYVTGQSFVENDYGMQGQMLTIKYNPSGVQQWARRLQLPISSAGFSVAVDASGNVYVAGEHYTTGDYVSMVTVKYSASGVSQWTRYAYYGYDYEESTAYDLALDGSGNVYVTGYLYKPSDAGIRDYMTAKYSPSGSQLWVRAYEGGGVDEAYDVAVDGSGNVSVAGTSGIVRYNSAGTQQWVGAFDGVAHALITAGGDVYAAGVADDDLLAARYDAAGARLWSTPFDLGGTEQAFALRLIGGVLYAAGSSATEGAGSDALMVGFDSATGGATGSDLFDGGYDDQAYAMAQSGTTDFWMAGTSSNGVDGDALIVKYTTRTGPVLQSLTLTPAIFAGACKTSTGRVTLSGPAPAGGAVVALSDTNPAATLPASVTVPAGATTAKFTITGTAVSSPQAGSVTASYGGVSKSATVTVRPIGVLKLVLSPNPVAGPNPVLGTVTLECPAGAGGVPVTLTSSSTAVARPAAPSFTVPAGATTGTFQVLTTDVAVVGYANIRATASGVWKAVKLTVQP